MEECKEGVKSEAKGIEEERQGSTERQERRQEAGDGETGGE